VTRDGTKTALRILLAGQIPFAVKTGLETAFETLAKGLLSAFISSAGC